MPDALSETAADGDSKPIRYYLQNAVQLGATMNVWFSPQRIPSSTRQRRARALAMIDTHHSRFPLESVHVGKLPWMSEPR